MYEAIRVGKAMKKHKIFSFFSGSGLLDLAFEQCGYEVAFANEYFQPFADAYIYSRQKLNIQLPEFGVNVCSIDDYLDEKNLEIKSNIMTARDEALSVGFIGGPPCPDFSIGGKNKGVLGENGKLSRSYFSLILDVKPDWFVFENVKGLWRTKKHRAFYEEMKTKLSAEYALSERLFNSLEAGAPQDRDRIILFGIRKSVSKLANINWEKGLKFPKRTAFEEFPWVNETPFNEGGLLPKPNNVPLELTVEYWFNKNEVLSHPNAQDCFKPKAGIEKFKSIAEGDVSRKSSKRLHRWRYSPTAAYGNNEVHLHPYKARRISVAEALAIQSMPKEFELPKSMTLTNKFKTIGNGVPYLLGEHLAMRIKGYLDENFV